jgi:hypothetical protein
MQLFLETSIQIRSDSIQCRYSRILVEINWFRVERHFTSFAKCSQKPALKSGLSLNLKVSSDTKSEWMTSESKISLLSLQECEELLSYHGLFVMWTFGGFSPIQVWGFFKLWSPARSHSRPGLAIAITRHELIDKCFNALLFPLIPTSVLFPTLEIRQIQWWNMMPNFCLNCQMRFQHACKAEAEQQCRFPLDADKTKRRRFKW